ERSDRGDRNGDRGPRRERSEERGEGDGDRRPRSRTRRRRSDVEEGQGTPEADRLADSSDTGNEATPSSEDA
ncbi:hypothetical protein, partial [uncultured Arsenicicoccus sp.]|uniref:hypothetical protein n=1 Tax=uncultured Arsenicicoccus sp. TaxID=491339 RepID=UPI0025924A37